MAGRPKPLSPPSSGLHVFGSMLRMHRESRGLKLTELSKMINNSPSTISETEHGNSRCDRSLAVAVDEALGLGVAMQHLWELQVKSAVYPKWFTWPKYEARATELSTFQVAAVYGLLQTPAYARALLVGDEGGVEARLGRQDILTRQDPPPPFLTCVMNESVLHHQIGSPEVMYEQLMYLVASVGDRICIQIVPNGSKRPFVTGAFVLATLEDRSEIAYLETAARGITTGDRSDISSLSESFARIRGDALPVDMSMELIARTAEKRWT